ncbi:MmgE/PrpD family protein [Paraburkholderia rhynchosiae]|uniref:2-methylcitrate dehydratase n=1 Tax=Paraburkholderia rhynchosiae TaxID=487049 RepID=A0A6J5CJH2_9BURK|nr:MmgE/PrpD family protein [Paraburkholderia rhynchosiae]CAB3738637.1 hypothetical protein LMG27174_06484 [Paraburkholderia rhynchosiae]
MVQPSSSAAPKGRDDTHGFTWPLAQFAHQIRWGDLPSAVQHEAVRAFVNWVGCVYGGASHPATRSAMSALGELSATGKSTALGHARKMDPLDATLVNGLAASANAYDDTHLSTIAHPTAPTAAALLAHAELHRVSGPDFLLALIISNEIQSRLSCALTVPPASCQLGFYMTGLTGAPGVAAGVGRSMGLSQQQLVWAIGIGATQGAGFRATHGTMCGGFVPANAGRSGLLAARFAAANFTCHEDALGGPNGFLQVFGQPPNPAALTDRLGERYECMNVAAKPYPAGCLVHPLIEACLQLVESEAFSSDDVARIELEVSKLGLGLTGKREPQHAYDAQVSIFHWAAAVIHSRRAALEEASDTCVLNPAVIELRKRVVATVADDLQADSARVAIVLRDGRRLKAEVGPCLGSAARPMTDEQVEAKFLAQTEPVLGAERAYQLVRHCWDLPSADDVGRAAPGFWG